MWWNETKSLVSKAQYPFSLQQTIDGGTIAAATTNSNDGDVTRNHIGNDLDAWIFKLNATGIMQWQKTHGRSQNDEIASISQITNGENIFLCNSSSNDGDVSGNHGSDDYWMVKLCASISCPQPFSGFKSTNIAATSAKINLLKRICATGYTVQCKAASASNWIAKTINTSTGAKSLTGLMPSTEYQPQQ